MKNKEYTNRSRSYTSIGKSAMSCTINKRFGPGSAVRTGSRLLQVKRLRAKLRKIENMNRLKLLQMVEDSNNFKGYYNTSPGSSRRNKGSNPKHKGLHLCNALQLFRLNTLNIKGGGGSPSIRAWARALHESSTLLFPKIPWGDNIVDDLGLTKVSPNQFKESKEIPKVQGLIKTKFNSKLRANTVSHLIVELEKVIRRHGYKGNEETQRAIEEFCYDPFKTLGLADNHGYNHKITAGFLNT